PTKSAVVATGFASISVATWPVNTTPSTAVTGRPFRVKAASVTVKATGPAVPPPGIGVNTVTWSVPSSLTLAAGTAADNWEELMKVVLRVAPFHFTTEDGTKFEPLTVKVKAPLPSTALV